MSEPGRPRALDEMKRREICAMISAGASLVNAAGYVGCAVSTIRRERERNPGFRDELRHAQSHLQLNSLQAMHRAAGSHWRAAAWMLERTDPDRFAPRRDAKGLTKRELRQFVSGLIQVIDREVADPVSRVNVFRGLDDIMPGSMQEAWSERQKARGLREAVQYFNAQRVPSDEEAIGKLLRQVQEEVKSFAPPEVAQTEQSIR